MQRPYCAEVLNTMERLSKLVFKQVAVMFTLEQDHGFIEKPIVNSGLTKSAGSVMGFIEHSTSISVD